MKISMKRALHSLTLACLGVAAAAPPALAGQYKNSRVALYVVVDATKRLADPKILQMEWVAVAKGFPIVLMNHYSKGIFYVLTIPEDVADPSNLPRGVTSAIKSCLQQDFPVRMDSPAQVALFAYDNGAFAVESFRPDDAEVAVSVVGDHVGLRNALTGESLKELAPAPPDPQERRPFRERPMEPPRTQFKIAAPLHSYLVFKTM